jgi:hypothetical protein
VRMRCKVRQVPSARTEFSEIEGGKIYPERLGLSLILNRLSQSRTDDDNYDDNNDAGFRLRDFRLPPRSR